MNAKLIFAATAAFAIFGTISNAAEPSVSAQNDNEPASSIAIASHRGYWDSERAERSQNSIASLRAAQEYGFWGSEFDLHLTTDEGILVFHDDEIEGKRIDGNPASEFENVRLNNGEKIPTFSEYLAQGSVNPKVMLVCELKVHPTPEQEDRLLELTVAELKKAGLYDPERVIFISFSRHICEVIAKTMPEFTNQYLSGDESPEDLAKDGINGIDYHFSALMAHPEWVEQAHSLGMSVNCWTVSTRENIEEMVKLGVDCITSDAPELVRAVLKEMGIKEL